MLHLSGWNFFHFCLLLLDPILSFPVAPLEYHPADINSSRMQQVVGRLVGPRRRLFRIHFPTDQSYGLSAGTSSRLGRSFLQSIPTRSQSTDTTSDEEPSMYVKSYRLDGIGKGSRVDITTNTGHKIATDVPVKMGGKDSAPQPVEMLLAAWMGCTQATALFVGRHMKQRRLLIERLEFEDIQGFRDERGALQLPIGKKLPEVPSRLQRITGTIRVIVKATSDRNGVASIDEIELLKQQTEARCPVANMITTSGCSIDVHWKLGTK